jgi:hypothetical protein
MTNLAIARPSYIISAIAAKEAAKLEAAYKLFRDSDEGWDCWNAGGRNLRSKKVIVEGRLMTQYYPWKSNPYKKGSFQHRAWEEGLGYAEWEDGMGYDL